jgi:TonB-linked SusC/RagA family outer membrane protein
MKKLILVCLLTGLGLSTLLAQTITITGTVSSSVEGEGPVPGATVRIKGTEIGTITDDKGIFSIAVTQNATHLVFSFIGMKTQEVAIVGRTEINVVMEPEVYVLDEVMVTTGYEIRRGQRSTSALTQFVSGEKLNEVRQTNINSALVGKVSGIQYLGQSAVALDRTGSVRLRGDGGFGSGNSAVYVVDGTIVPNSDDINLDEIKDISFLSGPSASAILGSQGANGAIIVTTKKTSMSDDHGINIEVNAGVMTSSIYILPEYQNEYAGGNVDTLIPYTWEAHHPAEWQSLDGKYYHDYADDSSWGPRMEGQEYIPWYAWYPGSKYTGTTASLLAQPDNIRDFYERGWTFNNNIAFSKADEAYNIRAVVGNVSVKGNLPGSDLSKTSLALKASIDLGKRFTFSSNVNFNTISINGEFNDGLNNQSSGSFNQFFHRNIDMNIMRELRGLRTPDGIYASWNHESPDIYDPDYTKDFYAAYFFFNYYTFFDHIQLPSRSDRLFGDISLTYNIIKGLDAKITYRRHQTNAWREEKYSTDLNDSQLGATVPWGNPKAKGYYSTYTAYETRENFEGLITYTNNLQDFTIHADAGLDFYRAISKSNSANTVDGLIIPNLYSITNSAEQPMIGNFRANEKYRAVFLRGDVGYRNFLYGEFTLRNDWFSTLPPSNNSVASKSFGAAVVFSDFLDLPFLSYGKLRVSWGEIPTAIPVYAYPGFDYVTGLYKWNGNSLTTTPDQVIDKSIHGAVKTQKEVGLDLGFLDNKYGIRATYWDGTEKDIPYPVTIASYSGFDTKYLNTGKIEKQGIDLTLNIKPVANENFIYEMNAIFSYLIKNDVVAIADSIDNFLVEFPGGIDWWPGAPAISQAEGQPWGVLKGNGIKMWQGKPMLEENGFYADTSKYFGSVLPKITGGIQNSFKILRNFTIIANLEYQFGGKYLSYSDFLGSRSGVTSKTAGYNDLGNPVRNPVDKNNPDIDVISGDEATPETGGIHITGVDAVTLEDVDYYVNAQYYYMNFMEGSGLFDPYVYDRSYIKLRELSIGYDLPIDKIAGLGKYVQVINISMTALNLWMIWADNRDFDPSEIPYPGGELSQFPGTRSFGINLKVRF